MQEMDLNNGDSCVFLEQSSCPSFEIDRDRNSWKDLFCCVLITRMSSFWGLHTFLRCKEKKPNLCGLQDGKSPSSLIHTHSPTDLAMIAPKSEDFFSRIFRFSQH